MKKLYLQPELLKIDFVASDVVLASPVGDDFGNDPYSEQII